LRVWLDQCGKGYIWLAQQTIQSFGLFPALHLSGQRTRGLLRQTDGRFNRASRSTQIVQLDIPKGSLGPAFGVQYFFACSSLDSTTQVKCG
jgi:hypothetical protein